MWLRASASKAARAKQPMEPQSSPEMRIQKLYEPRTHLPRPTKPLGLTSSSPTRASHDNLQPMDSYLRFLAPSSRALLQSYLNHCSRSRHFNRCPDPTAKIFDTADVTTWGDERGLEPYNSPFEVEIRPHLWVEKPFIVRSVFAVDGRRLPR